MILWICQSTHSSGNMCAPSVPVQCRRLFSYLHNPSSPNCPGSGEAAGSQDSLGGLCHSCACLYQSMGHPPLRCLPLCSCSMNLSMLLAMCLSLKWTLCSAFANALCGGSGRKCEDGFLTPASLELYGKALWETFFCDIFSLFSKFPEA